jgi:CubicO group peptidase (beta-lactamase class C family)/D-alanyl-D-alanine dipeptidase
MARLVTRSSLVACLWFLAVAGHGRSEPLIAPVKPYEEVARRLEAFIGKEVQSKGLPALSIALVDDQRIVWAKGFGYADPQTKKPATADTVYRVGSVSKLFTDLAVMQLVEKGQLSLDAPVRKYLPDFTPANPTGKAITLRQLMAHRSGLVREPPVGNYFDPTNPSLARMVESLNKTTLVYEPEQRTKYSNAAIATVGFVLEQTQDTHFARYLQRKLLAALGMEHSGFEPQEKLAGELAKAVMWTYHGREFPAPTFELGMAPAGSMYSTVQDLGRFLSVLFARGKSEHGVIVRPETLEQMWTPQFVKAGEKKGFGLGFMIDQKHGTRWIGHGGAIYGFSTELAALPDEKLGVVVIASRDVTNAVVEHIADVALADMVAVKRGKPLPAIEETTQLKPDLARRLAGHYRSGTKSLDLSQRDGRLFLLPGKGGFRVELRALGDALLVDDRLGHGQRIEVVKEKLKIGDDLFELVPQTEPAALPQRWAGLIGEYGWDHNTLVILERDGKLQPLIEWFFLYPLEEESADVYKFPDFGLYHGEKIVFRRSADGKATAAVAANVVFERRPIDGEDGRTFRLTPLRQVEELRREAKAAHPPAEKGDFRKSDLVELTALDATIRKDIRYATDNNFLGHPVYESAKAYIQRPAAEALVRVHRKLADRGYGLLVFDGYRPWWVTKVFWEATPPKFRIFVADPAKGSRHNRGCAVDLTLYDRKTGKAVEMVGGYDEFSDRSWPDYLGGTSRQRYHRDLLRQAMEEEGFAVYEAEWWHFDYKDWQKYAIGNASFTEVEKAARERDKR